MAKSRSFSIFLLKPDFSGEDSLKADHELIKCHNAKNLPEKAVLYLSDKPPTEPWWKGYWGIQQDLKQVLKGAIIFIPVAERCFAITFGHTYHNLKENSYEYDFGLKTTLNALDPKKIKSTDILQPEKAKRERIQSPTNSDLTFFDINHDESIIKKLTGYVKDDYKNLLTNITGASSLRISSKISPSEIPELCEKLLNIYKRDDYKQNFPEIHSIVPVKDPDIIQKLNNKLLQAFRDEAIELVLTIPAILDHKIPLYIKYSGAGKTDNIYDDIYIFQYREYLHEKQQSDKITIDTFKHHKLNILDEIGQTKESFSIFKCFLFDVDLNSSHYHLCDGEWYCIDAGYLEKIKKSLDPYFSSYDILDECNIKLEKKYNATIEKKYNDVICLDQKNIAPKGQSQVEPCDLLRIKDERIHLIHIKISTRSSTLSHLLNQGLVSAELLRLHAESKEKLKELSRKKLDKLKVRQLADLVKKEAFTVIYGIITAKDRSKKSDNLPLFSRISLKRTVDRLKLMNIPVYIVLIKDKVDRKNRSKTE